MKGLDGLVLDGLVRLDRLGSAPEGRESEAESRKSRQSILFHL